MTVSLATLREQTRNRVGDPYRKDSLGAVLAGPQTWSDAQIDEAIDFAIINFCTKTRATIVTSAPVAVPVGAQVPNPTRTIKVLDVLDSTLKPLLDSSLQFEDARNPGWRAVATGTHRRWWPEAGNSVQLYPRTPAVNVSFVYLEAPVSLTAADAAAALLVMMDPRIKDSYAPAMSYAASSYLLTQKKGADTRDMESAQSFMQVFNSLIGYSDRPKNGQQQPVQPVQE